jgi:hypothetical protein
MPIAPNNNDFQITRTSLSKLSIIVVSKTWKQEAALRSYSINSKKPNLKSHKRLDHNIDRPDLDKPNASSLHLRTGLRI